MNKKTKTSDKRVKLSLGMQTVANLTSDMLKMVAGGAKPYTEHSVCLSICC
jgi:hypothetical protein